MTFFSPCSCEVSEVFRLPPFSCSSVWIDVSTSAALVCNLGFGLGLGKTAASWLCSFPAASAQTRCWRCSDYTRTKRLLFWAIDKRSMLFSIPCLRMNDFIWHRNIFSVRDWDFRSRCLHINVGDDSNYKHCQRHNGPEGWVHSSQFTNLDQITNSEPQLSINLKISTKYQHLDKI